MEEEIEDMAEAYERKRILSTGNAEIDKKMGGGLPRGSLSLIEGANDTGKSVLTQQIMWGGLHQGFSIVSYTTENTIRSLIKQMDSLSLDISDFFILGRLKMYPIHIKGMEQDKDSSENMLQLILESIQRSDAEAIIIDSLTIFVVHSSEEQILDFFSGCKNLCGRDKTILITTHSYAFSESLLIRLRSICDAHISMKIEQAGNLLIKTMEIAKIRGAQKITGNIISFDVDPSFGLKIIPILKAKV